MRFAKERASWIEACLDEGPRAISFCENLIFPFRGVDHRLVHQPGELRLRTKLVPVQDVQDAHIEGDPYPKLLVGGEASHINRRVTDWLKREARKVLHAFCSLRLVQVHPNGTQDNQIEGSTRRHKRRKCRQTIRKPFNINTLME